MTFNLWTTFSFIHSLWFVAMSRMTDSYLTEFTELLWFHTSPWWFCYVTIAKEYHTTGVRCDRSQILLLVTIITDGLKNVYFWNYWLILTDILVFINPLLKINKLLCSFLSLWIWDISVMQAYLDDFFQILIAFFIQHVLLSLSWGNNCCWFPADMICSLSKLVIW